jgi:hypothetical protein
MVDTGPATTALGEGRFRRLVDLDEVAARMDETINQQDFAGLVHQTVVSGVAVDVAHAFEAGQLAQDFLLAATPGEDIDDSGRRGPLPGPIIGRVRPELANPRSPASGIEHRHWGLIDKQSAEAVHRLQLQIIQALEHHRRGLHPARQRLAVEGDAVAGQNLRLTVERRQPGVFGDGDVGDECCRRQAAFDEPRGRRRRTIGPSQARQAYLGRTVRNTRICAGARSSASLTSSPIRCICPLQQGQRVVSGSRIRSQRGRCFGRAPMLRRAFRFFLPESGFSDVSSLAASGGAASASDRSSANCSARIFAACSERAPKIKVLSVMISARKSSFSPSRARIISTSKAGSFGRSSGRSAMRKHYAETV